MYRISKNKRKHSTTPIVKVHIGLDGKEKEEIVLLSPLTSKIGDPLLESVVEFLNESDSSEYRKFNINHGVKVKLNELGYHKLMTKRNEILNIIPNSKKLELETIKLEADENGYTRFQLWDFMDVFGSVSGIDFPIYYDGNILIEN